MKREPEPERRDVALAALDAVRTIDQRDEAHDEALVSAFLCAAWPTLQAQNQ